MEQYGGAHVQYVDEVDLVEQHGDVQYGGEVDLVKHYVDVQHGGEVDLVRQYVAGVVGSYHCSPS